VIVTFDGKDEKCMAGCIKVELEWVYAIQTDIKFSVHDTFLE
jgi:hypothetical protein